MVPVGITERGEAFRRDQHGKESRAEKVVARESKQKDTTKANEEIDWSEWQCLDTCGSYVSERSIVA